MGEAYQKVPERLLEYRKKLNMTQKQMGSILGLEQNHYGKLEKGTVTISYEALMRLENALGGVYYIITGNDADRNILSQYFSICQTQEQEKRLLKLMVWVTEQGIYQSKKALEIPYQYKKEIQLQYQEESKEGVWEAIRRLEALTQQEMAKKLDIDVKRYRMLEKGRIFPDGYILANLYANLGYSPMAVMKPSRIILEGLSYIWAQFDEEIRGKINPFVESGIKLL